MSDPTLSRLGGPSGPLVVPAPEAHPWRGLQGWRVVEPGVWQGARWGRGTLIMAKESEAEERNADDEGEKEEQT